MSKIILFSPVELFKRAKLLDKEFPECAFAHRESLGPKKIFLIHVHKLNVFKRFYLLIFFNNNRYII
jgi:hypothetical protein